MEKKAVVVLADGFEEIEAVAPVDIMRRADIRVDVAGLDRKIVSSSRGLRIETDILFEELSDADALILPGGMPGAANLAGSGKVLNSIKNLYGKGRLIAAICASPAYVLIPSGILAGKKATGFPGTESMFRGIAEFISMPVVRDGNIITSRGAGTALEFSCSIAAYLAGAKKADDIRRSILIK
ncbi:MAG: DJ-1/PfpI family protein [Candidatus Aureabacteria bacterium]|nr:DJ-1/PfpI family protein [Candidatus Auribacterota bacterium]